MGKKLIALFVSIAMTVCCFNVTYANVSNDINEQIEETVQYEDTQFYTLRNDQKTATVVLFGSEEFFDVSVSYVEHNNKVYQFRISIDSPELHQLVKAKAWDQLILYAEDRIDDAEIITFTHLEDKHLVSVPLRSEVGRQLKSELRKLVGNEYSKKLKYSTTYKGQLIKIYEGMQLSITNAGSSSWNKASTIASIITGILGLSTTNTLVSTLCSVLGVAISTSSLVPKGGLKKYNCMAVVYHHATVNGSTYVYNSTEKTIKYRGYEDSDPNSELPSKIDSSSKEVIYSDNSEYFHSYTRQRNDAYAEFQRIGQKP